MMEERNRTSLEEALKRLPTYQPGKELWMQLSAVLPIDEHIEKVPPLTAPSAVWDKIDEELMYNESEKNRLSLKEAIALLPLYQAPEYLWNSLRKTLDQRAGKVRVLPMNRKSWSRVAAIAAVWVLFGMAMWVSNAHFHRPQTEAEKGLTGEISIDPVEMIYSEETLSPELGVESVDMLETTELLEPISNLKSMSRQLPDIPMDRLKSILNSQDTSLILLKQEWEELLQAERDIMEAVGAYNDDPRWVAKMAHIEREKAVVVKRILKTEGNSYETD